MNDQTEPGDVREIVYLLTEGCLRGEISPEETAQLDQLLRRDDALQYYMEYISQSVALGVWAMSLTEAEADETWVPSQQHSRGEPAAPNQPAVQSSRKEPILPMPDTWMSRCWQPVGFVFGVATAAVFLGVLMLWQGSFVDNAPVADRQEVREQSVAAAPAAYLISNTGCAWTGDSSMQRYAGSGVQLGEKISLVEGIAEFHLANGVYVSLEGPAEMMLTSHDSLALTYGKITAHVPWPVAEFQILAGVCRLAATDAEFGVSTTGNKIDVHVFSGEVLASDTSTDGSKIERNVADNVAPAVAGQRLAAAVVGSGRALALVANAEAFLEVRQWERAAPSLFATRLTMAGQLPVSPVYCDSVLASGPMGYWRFESGKGGVVPSAAAGGPDLKIVGDLRLSGLSGNRVAEFRPGSDCYLVSSQPLDAIARTDYSIEVWVKPSHVHCGTVLALCATVPNSAAQMNAFLLELQSTDRQYLRGSYSIEHPRTVRFLHRDPPSRNSRKGTSCFTGRPYRVRRWQHVVAVKRGEHMELYVDGKLGASAVDTTLLAPELLMVIGRQESTANRLQFIGQLDELAVYPRALNAEEISAHYYAIEWSESAKPASDSGGV